MSNSLQSGAHSAEASALGFYYQALFALLVLFQQNTDKAAVSVEQMDDVQLTTEGEELLYQLKHSFLETPTPIGLKSRAFWKTIKVWIDILDEISTSHHRSPSYPGRSAPVPTSRAARYCCPCRRDG
jgi:hypothetical protein